MHESDTSMKARVVWREVPDIRFFSTFKHIILRIYTHYDCLFINEAFVERILRTATNVAYVMFINKYEKQETRYPFKS